MNGIWIDRGVGVIIDHSWTVLTLGDTTDRRDETQLLHVLEEMVQKDNDHSFLAHHSHFFAKQFSEGMSRRKASSFVLEDQGLDWSKTGILCLAKRLSRMADIMDAPMDV